MILFPHLLSGAPPCLLLISPFGVESLAREEEEEGEEGRVKYRYVQECTSHEIVVIVGQKVVLSDFGSLQKVHLQFWCLRGPESEPAHLKPD